MARKKFQTVILMPYAPLKSELVIGNIRFVPFQHLKSNPTVDPTIIDHLSKIVSSYKFLGGHQIKNPTLVFVRNVNFRNPTSKSIGNIEAAKHIVSFLGIMRMLPFSFVTSDNFEVIYQRFTVGDPYISTQSGSIHRISAGGYRLTEVNFIKPEDINIPFDIRIDTKTLTAFNSELSKKPPTDDFLRILRALGFFFESYRNSYDVSWYSRILLIFIALETLLDCKKRKEFRDKIQVLCTHQRLQGKEKIYLYPILRTETGKKMGDENLTCKQVWAEEFYKLRHYIIHHGSLPTDWLVFKDLLGIIKRPAGHFYIAERVFISAVLQTLRRLGYSIVPDETIVEDPKEILRRENNDLYNAISYSFKP